MTISGNRYQAKPLRHGDRDSCTCPHCWTVFPLEDALYVSRHPELLGDPILGSDVPSRFKPSRFTTEGHAIDPGGYPCLELACPSCHLEVARSIFDFPSIFFSVIGMPQSGKSFFLTSLAWELRRILASHFAMSFTDLETNLNAKLHSYEETLFFPKDADAFVTLPKTEQQGEMYNRVSFDGVETLLPCPFLFTIKPQPHHPARPRTRPSFRGHSFCTTTPASTSARTKTRPPNPAPCTWPGPSACSSCSTPLRTPGFAPDWRCADPPRGRPRVREGRRPTWRPRTRPRTRPRARRRDWTPNSSPAGTRDGRTSASTKPPGGSAATSACPTGPSTASR